MSKTNKQYNKTITIWIVVLGVLATAVALAITFVIPNKTQLTSDMAQGFFTPIIAFELARTPMDLLFLTGSQDNIVALRDAFRSGLKLDMLFPFLYGGFILLLLIKALRTETNTGNNKQEFTTKAGVLFAFAIPFADLAENWAMLRVLDVLDAQEDVTGKLIAMLELTTWIKWLLIGLAFGMLMIHFFNQSKNNISNQNMPAVIAAICFVSTMLAFFTLKPVMGEVMALSVVLCIAYFLIKNSRELLLYLKP